MGASRAVVYYRDSGGPRNVKKKKPIMPPASQLSSPPNIMTECDESMRSDDNENYFQKQKSRGRSHQMMFLNSV